MIKRFYRIIFNGFIFNGLLNNSPKTKIRLLVLIVMFEKKTLLICSVTANIFSIGENKYFFKRKKEGKYDHTVPYPQSFNVVVFRTINGLKKFSLWTSKSKIKISMSIFNACCIFVGDLDSNHLITCIRFLILNFSSNLCGGTIRHKISSNIAYKSKKQEYTIEKCALLNRW